LSSFSIAPLTVSDLALTRGGRELFSGLSFALGPGELALVTGANGTGKTTLLRALAGFSVPARGRITLGDMPTSNLARGLEAPIAYQGHADGLKRDLTVAENLRFYAALWRCREPLGPVTEQLRLGDCLDRPVRQLSAGQRRRTALGCLRMRSAAVWLLDEPLTNLDERGTRLVESWVGNHLTGGGSAVVATHRPDELSRLASLVVEL